MSIFSAVSRSDPCSRISVGGLLSRFESLGSAAPACRRGSRMATAAPKRGLLGRMMLRKTVAQIQRETQTSELKRSLGPWNLVFLGIGCIIGAGIFVRTGNAAALHAGPAVLIAYAIAGLVCAFAALCTRSWLRRCRFRFAYTYSYTTLGEFAAWVLARCCCSNTGSPPRSSRSAGRVMSSACRGYRDPRSATLTGPPLPKELAADR